MSLDIISGHVLGDVFIPIAKREKYYTNSCQMWAEIWPINSRDTLKFSRSATNTRPLFDCKEKHFHAFLMYSRNFMSKQPLLQYDFHQKVIRNCSWRYISSENLIHQVRMRMCWQIRTLDSLPDVSLVERRPRNHLLSALI